jgi:hypothetical protein
MAQHGLLLLPPPPLLLLRSSIARIHKREAVRVAGDKSQSEMKSPVSEQVTSHERKRTERLAQNNRFRKCTKLQYKEGKSEGNVADETHFKARTTLDMAGMHTHG